MVSVATLRTRPQKNIEYNMVNWTKNYYIKSSRTSHTSMYKDNVITVTQILHREMVAVN